MAGVRVRVEDFEDGIYPDVCASSGLGGGTRLFRVEATHRPAWVWLLLFLPPLGWVAALVLSFALQKSVPGYLPYTDATQAMLQRRRRRAAKGLAASLVCFTGSLALSVSSNGGTGFAGLALLGSLAGGLGILVFAFLWLYVPGSVGPKLESNGRWVVLDPVSRRFRDAYDQQEARRRAARRAESATDLTVW